ncbi:hypothetical protein BH23PSE2_BH23PSE2_09820 [soil metagenome]
MTDSTDALRVYLASVKQALRTGQSGEHTHRGGIA